ncbi:MAG: ubiquinone biosynthesis hydroxylase [Pseudomonadota bacterium]
MTKTSPDTKSENAEHDYGKPHDIVIAGAGYVGMSLAVSVKQAAPHLSVMVVDPAPQGAFRNDPRASAIAAAASRMLDTMGVWKDLLAESQPINEMIVTDSKLADPVRPVFLTFGDAESETPDPFAHMVPNASLLTALHGRADELGVERMPRHVVADFERNGGSSKLSLKNVDTGEVEHQRTRLLVACDGVKSKLRDLAGIRTVRLPYNQMGIVTTVAHERDHGGRAEEHFLPAGPFATLPLPQKDGKHRSSIVWTEATPDAERLLALDEFEFELELEQRFGLQLGEISVDGPRNAYPLGLTLARDIVRDGFALAGDAAHGIHPIAGQGLNLGFKDVAALAQTIVETDRLGLDFSSLTALERYQSWRRFDTVQMGVTTDVLNRLFSNDNRLLMAARDLGLGIVDRLPRLKDAFIGQAAGNDLPGVLGRVQRHLLPEQPRLLIGKKI